MTDGLDASRTPPFTGCPPIPEAYYDFLARRWQVGAGEVAAPGARAVVAAGLDRPFFSGHAPTVWAWRSGRAEWLLTAREHGRRPPVALDGARSPQTGWPVALHAFLDAQPDHAGLTDDAWVIFAWPERLQSPADPLLSKQVRRLSANDARRLGALSPGREDAFRRQEAWAILDPAGRTVQSGLWTRAYSERLRSIGLETASACRNRGLATALLGVATRDLLAEGLVALYAARVSNPASQRVAAAVGFEPVARELLFLKRR